MALRQLSVQERAEARRKALQARQARAELKAAFAAGEVGLADIFARADADDAVARLRTVDLLLALPGVGEVRAREAMAGCGISPRRRLGGLGRRRPHRIAA